MPTTNTRIPQLCTDEEAMTTLGVDRMRLQTLINDGQLTAYYFPEEGLRLIPTELEEWKKEHEHR